MTVELNVTTDENALVVPATAVQPSASGQFVYVVGADRTAQVRPVYVSPPVGREEIIIARGLSAGEEVVIDGQLRLTPGTRRSRSPSGAEAAAAAGRPGGPGRTGRTGWPGRARTPGGSQ